MPNAVPTFAGSKKDLWLRLRNYNFDHLVPTHLMDAIVEAFGGADASTHAFADKLARKLRWKRAFAMRAIGEYKKFLYLGMVADFPVTPPRVLDQVWHEHLLFSRGYREFCDTVLGRPFDHNPELVPVDEQTERFQDQYLSTLELYAREFGHEPPAAFWATPKFAAPPAAKRRKREDDGGVISGSNDAPLYQQFDSSGGGGHSSLPEFGGGESGGGGGGAEWGGDGGGHGGGHGGDGHAGADSTGGHGDGGSGDGGGGGDGGGSGCSSGCGGGCGGS